MQIEKPEAVKYPARPFTPLQEKEFDALMELERQARQNSNMDLSQSTCKKIWDLLLKHGDPIKMITVVKSLTTKRGQIIRTVTELVKECMSFVEKIPDEGVKIYFVTELKNICDKKMYVEVEYARCAMILVKHNEKNNANLEEAAKIMENVQVETYSSMTKREKVEFILYQMHIQFILKDEIKLAIVSKKINPKMLEEPGFHILKIVYYLFLFYLNHKGKLYKECSSNLENVLEGLKLTQNQAELKDVDPILLSKYPFFLERNVLAEAILLFKSMEEHSFDKIESIDKLKSKYDEFLVNSKEILSLIESFLSKELTSCDLKFNVLRNFPVFNSQFDNSDEMLKCVHDQLIKKNLAIVAKFFKNTTLPRLAKILETEVDDVEDCLCDLIVNKIIKAKIDRPLKVVDFSLPEISNDDDMIDNWVKNINEIVDIIDLACERIEHEDVLVK